MILVDTSVWVHHLRSVEQTLVRLLEVGLALSHPFVTGELALGNLRQRDAIVSGLQDLPQAALATTEEVLRFVNHHQLYGMGIGYVDVHLLASVRLTPGASLWTRDKSLHNAAEILGLGWRGES